VSIGVTGMGIVCSVGHDVESVATALRLGACGIRADPWGPDGPPFAATLQGFSLADALSGRRGLPAELLEAAERSVRRAPLPLQAATATALEAWEHAGLHHARLSPERVAVVVAGNNLTGGYAEAQRPSFARCPSHLSGRFALHMLDTDHVGTISEVLGIRGEGFTVGGASASGNLALIQASRLLELDEVDACLVVGALADLSRMELQGMLNLGAMACRGPHDAPAQPGAAFDHAHRGFVVGQASASVILESSVSARRRGAPMLAELAGYGTSLDGNRLAAPSEVGESAAISRALDRAGLAPHQVSYVNTHGSASPLGDATELAALRAALGDSFGKPWINATKALTGHCLGAAGVVEAVATVMQIQGEHVHPNPFLHQPIDREGRFVGKLATPATVRFALSNSFGFGGINTSIVLTHPLAWAASTGRSERRWRPS
jgi:malonyl-ACP decarboxylase